MAEIDRICEVAGYLWEKGWAERNGGNISVLNGKIIAVSIGLIIWQPVSIGIQRNHETVAARSFRIKFRMQKIKKRRRHISVIVYFFGVTRKVRIS